MPNILIVDDSAVDRHLIEGLLTRVPGFEVIQAENGVEALAKIVEWNVDIVLADLQMPGMDGLQLVKTIRERFPNVTVILITGYGSEKIATQALNAGAASYVPKSQASELLVPTVRGVWEILASERTYGNLLPKATETKFEFMLENDPSLIGSVGDLCEKMLSGISTLDRSSRLRVVLAIEHAINNALYRGNLEIGPSHAIPLGDDISSPELRRLLAERCEKFADRKIYVCIKIGRSQIDCLIRDQGPGFALDIQPSMRDEQGRGLVLMRAFMDDIVIRKSGTEIFMRKSWQPAPGEQKSADTIGEDSQSAIDSALLGKLYNRKSGDVYQLIEPNLVIGSEESCHIVIREPEIEPHHCQLSYRDGIWFFKALTQESQVLLNGDPNTVGKLSTGDKLAIGNCVFEIKYQSAASAVT